MLSDSFEVLWISISGVLRLVFVGLSPYWAGFLRLTIARMIFRICRKTKQR